MTIETQIDKPELKKSDLINLTAQELADKFRPYSIQETILGAPYTNLRALGAIFGVLMGQLVNDLNEEEYTEIQAKNTEVNELVWKDRDIPEDFENNQIVTKEEFLVIEDITND